MKSKTNWKQTNCMIIDCCFQLLSYNLPTDERNCLFIKLFSTLNYSEFKRTSINGIGNFDRQTWPDSSRLSRRIRSWFQRYEINVKRGRGRVRSARWDPTHANNAHNIWRDRREKKRRSDEYLQGEGGKMEHVFLLWESSHGDRCRLIIRW